MHSVLLKSVHPENFSNADESSSTNMLYKAVISMKCINWDEPQVFQYYFIFPQEWRTENRGESIVGVRNFYLTARRRKLELTLSIRKVFRKDFNDLKKDNPSFTNDQIYDNIPEFKKSMESYDIIS